MVLEWVDGQTLASVEGARRGVGGRSPAEALALLRPVFEALAYAHEQGVAHRDIKPANIMLLAGATIEPTRHDKPTTRLLDFGIAKMMHPGEHGGSGHTRTRSTLLTFSLPYAAPEQVSGSRTGPWTDVHALALVLTELLTDRAPYVGTDPTEVCTQVLSPRRPTPGHFGVDAGCWEPVLARALALMPAERFQNADELFNALNADVPTVARHAAPVTLAGFAPTQMAPGAGHSTLRPREMDSTPPTPPRPPLSPRVLALTLGLAIALPLGLAMWRFRPRSEHTATAPASAPVRASAPSAVPAPPSPPAAPAPSQAVATPAPSAPVAPLAVSVRDADAGVNARPSASSGGRPPTRTRPRTDRSSGPPTAPVAPPAVVFVPVAPTPAPSAPTPHLATDRY
jgi:serine/threonine protein kinase